MTIKALKHRSELLALAADLVGSPRDCMTIKALKPCRQSSAQTQDHRQVPGTA